MRFAYALTLFLLLSSPLARAEWQVAESAKELSRSKLAEHWTTTATEDNLGLRAVLHLAVFDSRMATLRVLDQPNETRRDLATVITGTDAIAGVNGGYFDPENAPVGLLISEGRLLSPLRKAKLLTGILFTTANRVEIVRASHFSMKSRPQTAVQCGPLLIEHAESVAGLNDSRIARRTFVAVDGKGRTLIGISSPVSLAQLGRILCLTNDAGEFRTARAMNLDGGSSTAFWFAGEHGPISFPEQKIVRDFVLVVARSSTGH